MGTARDHKEQHMPRMLRRAAVLGTTARVASSRGAAKATAAQQAEPIDAAPVSAPAAPAAPAAPTDSYAQLMKLKELFDAGILTQDEFDAEKKKILSA
jgi:hypothetical protein